MPKLKRFFILSFFVGVLGSGSNIADRHNLPELSVLPILRPDSFYNIKGEQRAKALAELQSLKSKYSEYFSPAGFSPNPQEAFELELKRREYVEAAFLLGGKYGVFLNRGSDLIEKNKAYWRHLDYSQNLFAASMNVGLPTGTAVIEKNQICGKQLTTKAATMIILPTDANGSTENPIMIWQMIADYDDSQCESTGEVSVHQANYFTNAVMYSNIPCGAVPAYFMSEYFNGNYVRDLQVGPDLTQAFSSGTKISNALRCESNQIIGSIVPGLQGSGPTTSDELYLLSYGFNKLKSYDDQVQVWRYPGRY